MTLKIRLDWSRDSAGYRLVEHGKNRISIVGNGGALIPTPPLDGHGTVFYVFLRLTLPKELLNFVRRYGFLNAPAYGVEFATKNGMRKILAGERFRLNPDGAMKVIETKTYINGEDVQEHLETAELFRSILKQSEKGWKQVSNSLAISMTERLQDESLGEIGLIDDSNRGLCLTLTASSLLNAMWLQLATKISGGAKFHSCELATCGMPFEVGSVFGRRADARFCSDPHRIEFNSRKRSKSP
jgi:hypothetical protein